MAKQSGLYINCLVTKHKIADHEYTVLYDEAGNKYLKLEKFSIEPRPPKLDDGVADFRPILPREYWSKL